MTRRRKLVSTLGCAAVLAPVGYVLAVRWPGGGLRAGFGAFSGSWLPTETEGMEEKERLRLTQERAEALRAAVAAYKQSHGELPASLELLVPAHLPTVPTPLTSTMPFKLLRPKGGGFAIRWEAWPNAMYEHYWMDQDGQVGADM